jgi:hypothetical protein
MDEKTFRAYDLGFKYGMLAGLLVAAGVIAFILFAPWLVSMMVRGFG